MARSGDRSDLLAVGLRSGPPREPSAWEISEDATWVAAARDGDRAAFGQLYQRYARMVHGVLLAKVPVGDVDDLVQDVFIRALRRLSTLRETASFGAWLATIARNMAHDYHRRSVRVFQPGHAKAFPVVEPPDDEREFVRFWSLHPLLASRHVLAPRGRLPSHEFGDGGRDACKNLLGIHHLELAELQSWGLDDNHCASLSTMHDT